MNQAEVFVLLYSLRFKISKKAEVAANNLANFLKSIEIGKSSQAIGSESTNVNTGYEGDTMHRVEVRLGRKLNWLVCALYTNKFPLQYLVTALDGKTWQHNKWTGDLEKMLESATELEINSCFATITVSEPLISLNENIVKLGRKLNWLVCALYTNKFPLQYLVTALDGKTWQHNKWTGDLEKMLESATELEINSCFATITVSEPLISLNENIVKDFSKDESYDYKITQAIRTGNLPTNLNLLDPVNYSRWQTTANTFSCL